MDYLLDMHTHTLASGHAYSTIQEMAKSAYNKGLSVLGISEHGPAMPGSCHRMYFENLKVIPKQLEGVNILFGVELNILDDNGSVDMDDYLLDKLDYAIASLHRPCITPSTIENNTKAIVEAIKNPRIHIIGHPDDGQYPLDYPVIVQAAKEYHTLLELNNSSLNPKGFRKNTRENDIIILELCKKYEVSIIVNSDAHFSTEVGNINYALDVLKTVDFPEKLIVNNSIERMKEYMKH